MMAFVSQKNENSNLIIVFLSDRELQFWELSSFEPYCQVCSLHTVPIKLAYW
jgi:hypothetical protein